MLTCGFLRFMLILCGFVTATLVLLSIVSTFVFDEAYHGPAVERHPNSELGPYPGSTPNNLLWFVQVTDIHISRYRGMPERLAHFRNFLTHDIRTLKPEVLIITGDLTDAKDRSRQGSGQYEDEWKFYHAAIKDSKVENATTVLDIRGNHDAFNVPTLSDKTNMYAKYSVSGKKHARSYIHTVKKKFGQYSFLGVDSCPDPGLKRPFNFFGYLDQEEWKRLDHLKADSRRSNITVWFGHYPSSVVISSTARTFKSLVGDGIVYLSGHLHTLGGIAPRLYSIHKSGNLELELGDWLDNRMYRVMAVDHDIFSFSDETYNKWPVVLVTNPAHSAYLIPDREPTGRIKYSTHIRILAFSPDEIITVKVWVDNNRLGEAQNVGQNLYILPWIPAEYPRSQKHSITVQVIDALGRERTITQPFNIDPGQPQPLPSRFKNFILNMDASKFLKIVFLFTWLFSTAPLICLHLYGRILRGHFCGPLTSFIHKWYHHFLVLCRSPSLFYPVILLNLYLACGPWFVGYVMDDYIGVAFTFGVYVRGQLLPMHTTLAYGTIQMVTFNVPLTVSLASMADGVYHSQEQQTRKSRIKSVFNLGHSLFYSILALQVLKIVSNYLSYGTLSTLLSPLFLWQIILAFILKRRAGIVRRQLGGAHAQ